MKQLKILYVEDEPFLGKIVKDSLESRKFEVKMITDGAKVMDVFKTFHPDIAILDVMLPNIDGFTLGKMIKNQYPQLPILFLTAKTQTKDLLEGFAAGGNDYLKKPFSLEELIVRIDNLIQLTQNNFSEKTNNKSPIIIGKYTFDPEKYELRIDEHVKSLSYRENELLTMLLDPQKSTIQRKDILLHIWGDDSFFNSRNLDVYVTKLRDYLKKDPRVKIMTIKGVGYRVFVED